MLLRREGFPEGFQGVPTPGYVSIEKAWQRVRSEVGADDFDSVEYNVVPKGTALDPESLIQALQDRGIDLPENARVYVPTFLTDQFGLHDQDEWVRERFGVKANLLAVLIVIPDGAKPQAPDQNNS